MTTPQTNHTPTPWRQHDSPSAVIAIRAGSQTIAHVFKHIGSAVLMDQAHEGAGNADFILRAVNSHDELVAALTFIAQSSDFNGGTFPLELQQIARAALAKAGA